MLQNSGVTESGISLFLHKISEFTAGESNMSIAIRRDRDEFRGLLRKSSPAGRRSCQTLGDCVWDRPNSGEFGYRKRTLNYLAFPSMPRNHWSHPS